MPRPKMPYLSPAELLEAFLLKLERETSKSAAEFEIDPRRAFPLDAATAYAVKPDVAQAFAEAMAWAKLRHRHRASRDFDLKDRLTTGYVHAWRDYVLLLMATHLRLLCDVAPERAPALEATCERRMRDVREAYASPTPALARNIDRIRHDGRLRVQLRPLWAPEVWADHQSARDIVARLTAYAATKPSRSRIKQTACIT